MKQLIFLSIFALTLFSCARNSWDDNVFEDQQISNRFTTGSVRRQLVNLDHTDSSEMIMTYTYYSKLDSTFKDSVNTAISNYVLAFTDFGTGEKNTPLSQDYFEQRADHFVAIFEEEMAVDDIGGVWSMEADFGIDDSYKDFAELAVSAWAYTGGAHGNGSYTIEHFWKNSGKKMVPTDFFTNISALDSICEIYFRKLQGLTPEDDLGEVGFWFENNQFSTNNNFYFSGDKVTFYYNSYEIAPYAAGPTELEIPMDKIKHLLKRVI
jgi:hypothetical protein